MLGHIDMSSPSFVAPSLRDISLHDQASASRTLIRTMA
jgi:hypothetical protein